MAEAVEDRELTDAVGITGWVMNRMGELLMQFEWDPAKARSNLRKHRVSFDEAARVFLDPNRIETFDGRESYGEDRWKTVGVVEPALLAVVYTVRSEDDEIIRLISARKGRWIARKAVGFGNWRTSKNRSLLTPTARRGRRACVPSALQPEHARRV